MNNAFLQYVAESALCLLLFYLFYWLVLRKETCFRFNRFYLLGALLVATFLPLANLPAWPQPEPEIPTVQNLAYVPIDDYQMPEVTVVEPEAPIDIWPFIYLAYALGLLFFTFRFGYQLFSLYRYARQEGVYFKLTNHAPVIQTDGKMPTFSFLGYVFFDNTQTLTPEETERVLQHERVHIDQRHSLDILLVSVLGIVFWFNPLVRLYKNALEQTHEYLADAEVVRHANQQEYASLLLKQVFQKVGFAMGSYFFFNKSLTLNRIKMMKKLPQSPKARKVLLLLPLSLGLVGVIMAMRPAQALEPVSPIDSLKEAATSIFLSKDESRPAEFPGGREAANNFVRNNFTFPKIAFDRLSGVDKTVQAVASIEVEIDATGKATLSQVLEMEVSPNHPQVQQAIKQELARVVSLMPAWSPALKNGKAVASKEVIKIASVSTDFLSYSKYLEHRQQKTKVSSSTVDGAALQKQAATSKEITVVGYPTKDTAAKASFKEITVLGYPIKEKAGNEQKMDSTIEGITVVGKPMSARVQDEKKASTAEGKVFIAVEKMPEFPGGQKEMFKYLSEKFKLPAGEESGTIVGSFVVNKEGKITDVQVLKKLSPSLDKEFVRVLETMPTWVPGEQNGKKVAVKYTIPFRVIGNGQSKKTAPEAVEKQSEEKTVSSTSGNESPSKKQNSGYDERTKAILKFLDENFKMPAGVPTSLIPMRLYITYEVTKEDKVTNARVVARIAKNRPVNDVPPSVEKEIMRVFSLMPDYQPGQNEKTTGDHVNMAYTIGEK